LPSCYLPEFDADFLDQLSDLLIEFKTIAGGQVGFAIPAELLLVVTVCLREQAFVTTEHLGSEPVLVYLDRYDREIIPARIFIPGEVVITTSGS